MPLRYANLPLGLIAMATWGFGMHEGDLAAMAHLAYQNNYS